MKVLREFLYRELDAGDGVVVSLLRVADADQGVAFETERAWSPKPEWAPAAANAVRDLATELADGLREELEEGLTKRRTVRRWLGERLTVLAGAFERWPR